MPARYGVIRRYRTCPCGHFDGDGTPQSERIETVETVTPTVNGERLDYTLTARDPVMLTAPVTLRRCFVWNPEMSVGRFDCGERANLRLK